jgi:ABC-type polysaccharide/polyol phosphate export permease
MTTVIIIGIIVAVISILVRDSYKAWKEIKQLFDKY